MKTQILRQTCESARICLYYLLNIRQGEHGTIHLNPTCTFK